MASACAGVALSRARAPLFHLYDLANKSCRLAKDGSGRQHSALDWRFLYDEGLAVPASLRPYALDGTPKGAQWWSRDAGPLSGQAAAPRIAFRRSAAAICVFGIVLPGQDGRFHAPIRQAFARFRACPRPAIEGRAT